VDVVQSLRNRNITVALGRIQSKTSSFKNFRMKKGYLTLILNLVKFDAKDESHHVSGTSNTVSMP
jgi:hypothetical protein